MKVLKILLISFVVVLPSFAKAQEVDPETLLQKIYRAQKDLEEIEINFRIQTSSCPLRRKVKGQIQTIKIKCELVSQREIALRAEDFETGAPHTIYLSVPHPLPAQFTFSVLTPDYKVEHVSGRTVSKLVFRALYQQKKLVVLAGKHFWVPPELAKSRSRELLKERSLEAIYTPFAEDLYDEGAYLEGARFLISKVQSSQAGLAERQVVSRALRKLLAEAMPWEYILNLGLNEQMDHSKFKADPARTAKEVLMEYAFNRDNAFRWSVSSANARGAYQFTNKNRRGRAGTYNAVVTNYEDAKLIEDFEEGTQNLSNIIKMAICLLDMELAKFPLDARELFEKDYRKAAIYQSACYNGGCGVGFALYRWIKKNKYEINLDDFNPPIQAFTYYKRVRLKTGKYAFRKIVSAETRTYIQKQMYLWSFIDELKKELQKEQLK